jgi:hypothetical protein
MVGPLVDVTFVGNLGLGERGVESGPSAGDAGVELAVLRVDRRLYLSTTGNPI